jgi:hypothetical protein
VTTISFVKGDLRSTAMHGTTLSCCICGRILADRGKARQSNRGPHAAYNDDKEKTRPKEVSQSRQKKERQKGLKPHILGGVRPRKPQKPRVTTASENNTVHVDDLDYLLSSITIFFWGGFSLTSLRRSLQGQSDYSREDSQAKYIYVVAHRGLHFRTLCNG